MPRGLAARACRAHTRARHRAPSSRPWSAARPAATDRPSESSPAPYSRPSGFSSRASIARSARAPIRHCTGKLALGRLPLRAESLESVAAHLGYASAQPLRRRLSLGMNPRMTKAYLKLGVLALACCPQALWADDAPLPPA